MHPALNRRQFLERATLGVAALTAARHGRRSAASPAARHVHLDAALGRRPQCRLAGPGPPRRRQGYKGIDWAWGPVRQAGVDATRALLAELQIYPTIVNMPGPNVLTADEATFKGSLGNSMTTRPLPPPWAAPGSNARWEPRRPAGARKTTIGNSLPTGSGPCRRSFRSTRYT